MSVQSQDGGVEGVDQSEESKKTLISRRGSAGEENRSVTGREVEGINQPEGENKLLISREGISSEGGPNQPEELGVDQ
jgi:hypothetical protein